MVYPYLTYCNINWESTYRTRLRSIHIAQKKIVRLMTFSSFRETSQPLFKLLKKMNIYEINLNLIANFMYLHYYGKLSEPFNDYFVINDSWPSTILGQLQKYTSILKEQIMENFSLLFFSLSLPNDLKELKSSNALRKHYTYNLYNQRKILFDTLNNI